MLLGLLMLRQQWTSR